MRLATIFLLVALAAGQTQTSSNVTTAATADAAQQLERDFLQEPASAQLAVPQTALTQYIDPNSGTITNEHAAYLIKELFDQTTQTLNGEHASGIDYARRNFSGLFSQPQSKAARGVDELNQKLIRQGPFIINVVVWAVQNNANSGAESPASNTAPGTSSTSSTTSNTSTTTSNTANTTSSTPSGTTTTNNPSTRYVPDQRWYTYQKGKLSTGRRLLGYHRFCFIYIHLNRSTVSYPVRYDFTITQTTPTNLQHLYQLASILVSGVAAGGRQGQQYFAWGGKQIESSYNTSDIVISSRITGDNDTGSSNLQAPSNNSAVPPANTSAPSTSTQPTSATSTSNATPPSSSITNTNNTSTAASGNANQQSTSGKVASTGDLDSPQTFHNEGASWWDVSLGFPATNVNQLTFQSTGAGLVPQTTDRRRLLGLLNIYPIPQQRLQLAQRNFSWIPSIVVGVPLANQPLHRPLFAAGWGPPLLQFYAGAMVIKQPTAPQVNALVQANARAGARNFRLELTLA